MKKARVFVSVLGMCLLFAACLLKNRRNNDEKEITPIEIEWTKEQEIKGKMFDLDYADENSIIVHNAMGVFVYGLSEGKMIRSLDWSSIGCSEEDREECTVYTSKDGTKLIMHPRNDENMYVYKIADNLLVCQKYETQRDYFEQKKETAYVLGMATSSFNLDNGTAGNGPRFPYSEHAIEFDGEEVAYLITTGWTLDTVKYVRGQHKIFLFENQ